MLHNPQSFDKSTKKVLIKQIYFTSVQILPLFLLVSLVFGSAVVGIPLGALKNLDLLNSLGEMFFDFVATEIAPLTTVFLIILRSSSATNAEIAVMRVNGELDSLNAFGIDPKRYLVLPRLISMTIALAALTTLFIFISIIIGSIYGTLFFDMSFDLYFDKIVNFISFKSGLILYIKTTLFGIAISAIPIHSGLNAVKRLSFIPISVLRGMVGVFKAIIFIEVITFTIKSI